MTLLVLVGFESPVFMKLCADAIFYKWQKRKNSTHLSVSMHPSMPEFKAYLRHTYMLDSFPYVCIHALAYGILAL